MTISSPPLPASLPEPRVKIRTYLRELFAGIGRELPESWPNVSPSEFAEYRQALSDRIDGLYQYIDSQTHIKAIQKQFARFFPETTLQLLRLDWAQPEQRHAVTEDTLQRLERRPPAIVAYDQLYCTPDSTERRANRILETIPQDSSSRVLFLGDDDLGSVILAPRFAGEVHVIDLDDRLLDYIEEQAPNTFLHKVDLFLGGLSRDMYESYDAVVLDPPWDEDASWLFLAKAIVCLKQVPHARIFLSFCPLEMELAGGAMSRMWRRLAQHGITPEAIETSFNLYDLVATETEGYQKLMKLYLPPISSPLMDLLRQAPYAFAHMYQLRRIEHFRPNRLRKWMLDWWHTSSSS